jgi:uncharacterized membrane protein (UPF0182 family)
MPPDPGAPRPAPVLNRPQRGRVLLPTVLVLGALGVIFGIFTTFYTEYLWFDSVDFVQVWRTELVTKGAMFIVFGLLMAVAVAVNAIVAYRSRPMYQPMSPEQQNLDRYRQSIEPFRKAIVAGGAVVLGLLAGSSAAGEWKTFLLWRNSEPFGQRDPQFNVDISFYVFTLPWFRFLVGFGFALVVVSALVALATHYLYGGLRLQSAGDKTTPGTRVHLSVLIGLFVLLKAVAYWLDRYSLAVADGQVGNESFVGLTYTDVNAVLYSKIILMIISVICAVLFFANIVRKTWLLPGLSVGLLLLVAVLVGGVYPMVVQALQVRPSEPVREAPYIERNIEATRTAYGVDGAEITNYDATTEVQPTQLREDAETASVRLLDPAVVSSTYQALQQIRDFYAFTTPLDVDRYEYDGSTRDTVVAVREIDITRIPADRRNWNNDHLINTHGFGFVAARGNRLEADGEPSFIESNIPSQGLLEIEQPRIYFGERSPEYSIVGAPEGANPAELDYPDDTSPTGQQNFTYDGAGGIPVGNFLHQILYAAKFRDPNILLSEGVNSESKILYERAPRDRVQEVAPWLELDGNPYPAVVDGKIVWIIDGYTTSNGFPYAQRTTLEQATTDAITQTRGAAVVAQAQERVNYIRNSVKATVDAYDGTVTLYAWDEADPVLQAWMKAFPDTVEPRDAISEELLGHLRYPEDLFKVQRNMLTRYHVTDARAFYTGQDFWRIPNDPTQSTDVPQPPYYLTLAMPGEEEPSFSLTTTFVPRGRPQLSAFMAVNANPGEDYGKIQILQLPRNTAVPGPEQVQNQFSANSEVATVINILQRGDSVVEYGNLLTLPLGGGLLYVEPVYVRATGEAAYPILQRVLVSFGDRIAFEPTLSEALDSLFAGRVTETPVEDIEDPSSSPEPTPPAQESPEPSPSPTGDGGDTPPPPAAEPGDLGAALQEADDALADAQAALSRGDFAAYGEAQERLEAAIERALAAQRAGGGGAGDAPAAGETPAADPGADGGGVALGGVRSASLPAMLRSLG